MRLLSALRPTHELKGKTALVRINLDIKNPKPESLRIQAVIPTLQYLLDNGAKPLILSHRGRPFGAAQGKPSGADISLSLKSAVGILSETLKTKLDWLENLRFDPREEKNDAGFAAELAKKGDIYINDDFATSHRTATSLVAITKLLPAYAGLRLELEVKNLSAVRENPTLPLVVVLGGVKIEDKLGAIERLKKYKAIFLLGSAYAIPREALPYEAEIIMPHDFISEGGTHLDIGPHTAATYARIISRAKTVIWSGPVGMVEDPRYAAGSRAIAEAVRASGAFSIAGGGDTADFLEYEKRTDAFSFVSTGGGAMLAFLAGDTLPAIEALEEV